MSRERLPNRRQGATIEFDFSGSHFRATTGYYPDGRLGEIFAEGAKPGSAMDFIIADAAILASLLLQEGVTQKRIAASLSRHSDGAPASVIAKIVDELAKLDDMQAVP